MGHPQQSDDPLDDVRVGEADDRRVPELNNPKVARGTSGFPQYRVAGLTKEKGKAKEVSHMMEMPKAQKSSKSRNAMQQVEGRNVIATSTEAEKSVVSEIISLDNIKVDAILEKDICKRQPPVFGAVPLTPASTPYPRNKPCFCGSRRKFKKCHGSGITALGAVQETADQARGSEESSRRQSQENSSMTSSGHGVSSTTSIASTAIQSDTSEKSEVSVGALQQSNDAISQDDDDSGVYVEQAELGGASKDEEATGHLQFLPEDDPNATKHAGFVGLPPFRDPTWFMDEGRFRMNEILVALGKNDLDEQRHRRLKSSFKLLFKSLAGVY